MRDKALLPIRLMHLNAMGEIAKILKESIIIKNWAVKQPLLQFISKKKLKMLRF